MSNLKWSKAPHPVHTHVLEDVALANGGRFLLRRANDSTWMAFFVPVGAKTIFHGVDGVVGLGSHFTLREAKLACQNYSS